MSRLGVLPPAVAGEIPQASWIQNATGWARGPSARRLWLSLSAAVLAAVWLRFLSSWGIHSSSLDSAGYLGVVDNLTSGHGLSLPFVPHNAGIPLNDAVGFRGEAPLFGGAPVFPVLLASLVLVGFAPTNAAVLLNLACFALIAGLVYWTVLRWTRDSWVTATLATLMLLTTSRFVVWFLRVLTDPIFTVLTLLALGMLTWFLATGRSRFAVAFCVLAATAALTRHIGVALAVTGALAILIWPDERRATRVRRAALVGVLPVIPALVWQVTQVLGPTLANGSDVQPSFPRHLDELFTLLPTTWLTGGWHSGWTIAVGTLLAVGLVAALAAVGVTTLRSLRQPPNPSADKGPEAQLERAGVLVILVFLVAYVVVLLIVMTLLPTAVPADLRYFLPILPPVVILLAVGGWRLASALRQRRGTAVAFLVVASLISVPLAFHVSGAQVTWDLSRAAKRQHRTSLISHASRAMLQRLPADEIIFTTAPHTVYRETGRFAVPIPYRRTDWGGRNQRFRAQQRELGEYLCQSGGVVWLIDTTKYAGIAVKDLLKHAGLREADFFSFPDGHLLEADPATCARLSSASERS